jgi:hypothetical protein
VAGKLDLLRSLLRGAADAGRDRIAKLGPLERAKQALGEIRERRTRVTEGAISAAIARVPGIRETTVSIHDGRVIVDAAYDDGRAVVLSTAPELARFAPRGAKEILFSIDPPELAKDSRARELIGAIGAAMARGLWGAFLPPAPGSEVAFSEREGDRVRVDLRTIPAVESVLRGSPLAQALEIVSIESFTIEDRSIRIRIALPLPFGSGR